MPRSAGLQWCVVNLNDCRVSAFCVGLTLRPRLLTTCSEIPIHKFAHDGHSNKSKNPAHHTTRSKLALSRAVVKFRFALWFAGLSVRNRLARSSRVRRKSQQLAARAPKVKCLAWPSLALVTTVAKPGHFF